MAEATDPIVAALLRERAALATHGRADRVAQVDAELAARGYVGESVEKLVPADPPKGRRSAKHDAT